MKSPMKMNPRMKSLSCCYLAVGYIVAVAVCIVVEAVQFGYVQGAGLQPGRYCLNPQLPMYEPALLLLVADNCRRCHSLYNLYLCSQQLNQVNLNRGKAC